MCSKTDTEETWLSNVRHSGEGCKAGKEDSFLPVCSFSWVMSERQDRQKRRQRNSFIFNKH
jgi:hypothetical protein